MALRHPASEVRLYRAPDRSAFTEPANRPMPNNQITLSLDPLVGRGLTAPPIGNVHIRLRINREDPELCEIALAFTDRIIAAAVLHRLSRQILVSLKPVTSVKLVE